MQALFPGEDIRVNASDEAIILSGQVSSNPVMLRAGEIAQATSAKARVINMLQLPGGAESQQVILQVRFAEVNRRAMTELGVSLFTGATGLQGLHRHGRRTQQFSGAGFRQAWSGLKRTVRSVTSGEITFSDFLNLFVFNTKYNIGALIKALQSTGFFQSLAEPNLIAYNGQEASFLAGGEIPVPVVQGATGSVTVEYKEFGIRLNVPTDDCRRRDPPAACGPRSARSISATASRSPVFEFRRSRPGEPKPTSSFATASRS